MDEPIAYAAPGDPGCVVVSRALLDVLGNRERQVVLAHERAHLHLHHHRYLLIGEIAAAVIPLLRPLADQIRPATERSADEAAAEALGGDRHLVARTIARVALITVMAASSLTLVAGSTQLHHLVELVAHVCIR